MSQGPVVGIDPGSKRIGVAISDPGGRIAFPLAVIDRGAGHARRIAEIVIERQACRVVVGLPKSMSAKEGAAAQEARKLADEILEAVSVPVDLFDERLTSVAANRAMSAGRVSEKQRRGKIDKVAAALMLQAYLDSRGS